MVTKKVVKKAQKKMVKKKIALKKPKIIQNIDLIDYFKTGKKKYSEECVYIEGNILQCVTDYPKKGDTESVAIKVGKYTIINGDDVEDNIGDFGDVVDNMQDYDDNEITTSFVCLKNAGINLHKVKVLEITKDLNVRSLCGDKSFDGFEFTVPQGATYKEYGGVNYDEEGANIIVEKRYHRAGCILLREGKHSYICGMDEDSYFVTELPKNTTTIDKAFQSLKPKIIQLWEKNNKSQAMRQGEWFFIPTTLEKVNGMRRKALPLWKQGGNKHVCDHYVVQDGKHYVKGCVVHTDHKTLILGHIIHEVHLNTALGSWSKQGVD